MQLQKESERFCDDILNLGTNYPKCLSSLVMSLSSNRSAGSVVELSESPLYRHSYSSISQVVSTLSMDKSSQSSEQNPVQRALQKLYLSYFKSQEVYVLQTDVSPIEKPHSRKMGERHYIHTPNHNRLMQDESLPFGNARLVINESDTGYATPRFIAPLISQYSNLVRVIRFGNSSKVWRQAPQNTDANKVGATAIYGETTYYLQLASGEYTSFKSLMKQQVNCFLKNRCSSLFLVP